MGDSQAFLAAGKVTSSLSSAVRETDLLTPRQRGRRRRRLAIGAGLSIIALACIGVLVSLILTQSTPAWWNQAVDVRDHSQERASGFESLLVTELNRVRDGKRPAPDKPWQSESWAVAMQPGDVNAWLEFAAPKWARNRGENLWPSELEQLRVHFEDDCVLIGARIRAGSQFHVLSARLTPRIDEEGALWFTTTSISVGRLSLPSSWVIRHAPSMLDRYLPLSIQSNSESARVFAALEGTQPVLDRAAIQLADGRRVQIIELHSRENRLEIVARTQQR